MWVSHRAACSSESEEVAALTLAVDNVSEDEGGAQAFPRALGADAHKAFGLAGRIGVRHSDRQNTAWNDTENKSESTNVHKRLQTVLPIAGSLFCLCASVPD